MRKVDFRFDPPPGTPRKLSPADFAAECAAAGLEPRASVGTMTLDKTWQGIPAGAAVLVICGTSGGSVFAADSNAGDVLTLRDPSTGLPPVADLAVEATRRGPVIITMEGGGLEARRHTSADTALDAAWVLDELRQRGAGEREGAEPVAVYEGDLTALLLAQTEADELREQCADLAKQLAAAKAELVEHLQRASTAEATRAG